MLMGCLGLFIVVGIIGTIGKNFGSFWAVVATVTFLALGFWGNKKEKAKQKQQSNKLSNHQFNTTATFKSNKAIQFWYTDYEGNITYRTVDIIKLDNEYLNAFCHDRQDLRTFKVERIDDEIIDLSTGEILSKKAWLVNNGITQIIKQQQSYKTKSIEDEFAYEICFTGFKKSDRERLEDLAKLNGYIVRKSITQNLDYLVYGEKAGLSKIAEAERKFVIIIDESEFLEIIENE